MGRWHEIARYENIFEKGLMGVKTNYTLLPDGTVKIENRGITHSGKTKRIYGTAYRPYSQLPAHFRVSFFWWFSSDYNVIMLDDDYQFSVVSGNTGKYLWILSRTATLKTEVLDKIFAFLRSRGHNPSRLIFT